MRLRMVTLAQTVPSKVQQRATCLFILLQSWLWPRERQVFILSLKHTLADYLRFLRIDFRRSLEFIAYVAGNPVLSTMYLLLTGLTMWLESRRSHVG